MKTKITSPTFGFGTLGARAVSLALPSTRWIVRRVMVLFFALAMLGSSAIPAHLARLDHFSMAVAGYSWDLIGWEAGALFEKAVAAVKQPADELGDTAATQAVISYLNRASRIGEIERELTRRASLATSASAAPTTDQLTFELGELRSDQDAVRPQVEQVIERQVSTLLAEADFYWIGQQVWPPVSFTFVEPPKKLVVSRRDRIETIYSQMLEADISLSEIIDAEGDIYEQFNAVGYVTDIGGLGAFPTMVVDRASLRWVLSTVAHEWTHNYLVFHALGWNYFKSQDMTTINESVAEIVGNEIGDQVLGRYYPEMVPPPSTSSSASESGANTSEDVSAPPVFSFQDEMRVTRLEVDRMLNAGDVAGAEAYMEARRQIFVENGYALRALNQAYFAFHGSYGTSPASTSPIGPKLDALRAAMPDVASFLETVREFTTPEDLDNALALWEAKEEVTR